MSTPLPKPVASPLVAEAAAGAPPPSSASPLSPALSAADEQKLFRLQLRAFGLTWFGYASYYFTRKNVSVVKSRLHDALGITTEQLGTLDTSYLVFYAIGQFTNGTLGDRLGSRRLLAIGLFMSALASVVFGLSSSFLPMLVAFSVNGFFQSTGWPGSVKAMQPFFSSAQRGRVMGLWTTNYQAGGLLATAAATFLLVHFGWRAAFMAPALYVFLICALIRLFLVEKPEDRGLPPVEPEVAITAATLARAAEVAPSPPQPTLGQILRLKVLWALGAAYFAIKLIRYSLLFWLPFYLRQHLHYDEGLAGYLSMPFEIGGIVGSVTIGWISDRYFRARRLVVAAPVLFLMGGALFAYQLLGGVSVVVNAIVLGLVGFCLFGPDSLISGTVAQDIGGRHATARVAGVINGTGSIGAIFSPLLVAVVTKRLGWDYLFYGFVSVAIFASLLVAVARLLQRTGRGGSLH